MTGSGLRESDVNRTVEIVNFKLFVNYATRYAQTLSFRLTGALL